MLHKMKLNESPFERIKKGFRNNIRDLGKK